MEARESSTETARTDAVYGVSWMDGVLCSTWMSPIVTRGGGGGGDGTIVDGRCDVYTTSKTCVLWDA